MKLPFSFFSMLQIHDERTQIPYEPKMCVTDSILKMLQVHYKEATDSL